jgi:hypothetical protein
MIVNEDIGNGNDEKVLNQLIRQAGDEARERKSKILASHYMKIQLVVAKGLTRRQFNTTSEISE